MGESEFWASKCADPVYMRQLRQRVEEVRERLRSASVLKFAFCGHLVMFTLVLFVRYARSEPPGFITSLLLNTMLMMIGFTLAVDIFSFLKLHGMAPLELTALEMEVLGVKDTDFGFKCMDERPSEKPVQRVRPERREKSISRSGADTSGSMNRKSSFFDCSSSSSSSMRLTNRSYNSLSDSGSASFLSSFGFSLFGSSPEKSRSILDGLDLCEMLPCWCYKINMDVPMNSLSNYRTNLVEWLQTNLIAKLVEDKETGSLPKSVRAVWMNAMPDFKSYICSRLKSIHNSGIRLCLREEKRRPAQMESLPFDSELVFCLFCGYMDNITLGSLSNERPFSDRFVLNTFRPDNFNPVCYRNEKTRLVIVEDEIAEHRTPIYGIRKDGGSIVRTLTQENSVIDAIIAFLFIVKNDWGGWINQVNLASKNQSTILNIFADKHQRSR